MLPLYFITPFDGSISPLMILSSVDFPQPDGPIILINSPSSTVKFISFMASVTPFIL